MNPGTDAGITIRRLGDLDTPAPAIAAIERIFFASTLRTRFDDEDARARFLQTWTSWYLSEAPADVLLAESADGAVAGYLTGCRDSAAATALFQRIPRYALFADLFAQFPAHLHVNVAPSARGRGIGAALIGAFATACGCGLHVVTSPGLRNVGFYQRNGFTVAVERSPVLFLGRSAGPIKPA